MTTNTLTLRSLDIPSVHRFGIGFDSMLDELHRINLQQPTNYPPYNIVQINEDEFMISVAVAGFGEDNLTVTKEKNFLVIEGTHCREKIKTDEVNFLHKGISERSFRREFRLADYVEISNAHLELGILNLLLTREVPEEKKPKKIQITTG